jgi:hypothetical protein
MVCEKPAAIAKVEERHEKASRLVRDLVDTWYALAPEQPAYDTCLVWFCKTLQNWKALVITTLPDNMYFEVTYNGDKKETYIDVYDKTQNVVVRDFEYTGGVTIHD